MVIGPQAFFYRLYAADWQAAGLLSTLIDTSPVATESTWVASDRGFQGSAGYVTHWTCVCFVVNDRCCFMGDFQVHIHFPKSSYRLLSHTPSDRSFWFSLTGWSDHLPITLELLVFP